MAKTCPWQAFVSRGELLRGLVLKHEKSVNWCKQVCLRSCFESHKLLAFYLLGMAKLIENIIAGKLQIYALQL